MGQHLKQLIPIRRSRVTMRFGGGGLSGRRKIARTFFAISDRLGSANPDQFDEQDVQDFGSTAFWEVESWSASFKKVSNTDHSLSNA